MTIMSENPPAERFFEDPRCESDFQERYFPTANGLSAPDIHTTESNAQIVLQFLGAYYKLNLEHLQLSELKQNPHPSRQAEMERECLQRVEKVLILRDRLEDVYAPLGVIAEPIVKGGLTVDLKIRFGDRDVTGRRRTDAYTLTAIVPIPMPVGATFEDVHMKIEGPGFNGDY